MDGDESSLVGDGLHHGQRPLDGFLQQELSVEPSELGEKVAQTFAVRCAADAGRRGAHGSLQEHREPHDRSKVVLTGDHPCRWLRHPEFVERARSRDLVLHPAQRAEWRHEGRYRQSIFERRKHRDLLLRREDDIYATPSRDGDRRIQPPERIAAEGRHRMDTPHVPREAREA